MLLELQVDGGQRGKIDVYRVVWEDAHGPHDFGYLAATGPAGGAAPKIGGRDALPNTEYWFFDPERWDALVRRFGDLQNNPDLLVRFDLQGEEDDFPVPSNMTASYAAPEETTWQDARDASWPPGALAFSRRDESGVVRGVGFSPGTGGAAKVFWALTEQVMITSAMLAGVRFWATTPTTGAIWYAVSNLRAMSEK